MVVALLFGNHVLHLDKYICLMGVRYRRLGLDGGANTFARMWLSKYICAMVAQIRLNMVLQIRLHNGGTNTCQSLPPSTLWAGQLTHKGSCHHLLKSKEQPHSIVFVLKTLFLLSLCPIRALPATCPTRLIQN